MNVTAIEKIEKIEFKNVSFNYPSRKDVPVLTDLTFTINRGIVQSVFFLWRRFCVVTHLNHSDWGFSEILAKAKRNFAKSCLFRGSLRVIFLVVDKDFFCN